MGARDRVWWTVQSDGCALPLPVLFPPAMSEQLRNLRLGYETLERRVRIALQTQMGDEPRLRRQITECLRFLSAAEQVNGDLNI